jgi:queuine tRNA-ribosyltransferase
MQDDRHRRDKGPVDERCDCPCCRRYARAYLHHLFQINEPLAFRLATLHNLRFYARLMERLQTRGME